MKPEEWRPNNWLNPVQMKDFDDVGVCQGHIELYEVGASAMLAALIKWLFGECTKHPIPKQQGDNNSSPTYHQHYRCWKCMEELKESGL